MEEDELKKFKNQHIESYRGAILENIRNNTNVLVDDDIMSLIKKPPLDSMDLIKTKFFTLAKKNKIVLDTDILVNILNDYRNDILKCCDEVRTIRIDGLSIIVNNVSFENKNDIIKINKKDFIPINKKIKKIIKDQLLSSFNEMILNNINNIFSSDVEKELKSKFINDISKYIKSSYHKQLLENVDIKILVKDTTLANSLKEQAERYIFTLNNSRLLNSNFD